MIRILTTDISIKFQVFTRRQRFVGKCSGSKIRRNRFGRRIRWRRSLRFWRRRCRVRHGRTRLAARRSRLRSRISRVRSDLRSLVVRWSDGALVRSLEKYSLSAKEQIGRKYFAGQLFHFSFEIYQLHSVSIYFNMKLSCKLQYLKEQN